MKKKKKQKIQSEFRRPETRKKNLSQINQFKEKQKIKSSGVGKLPKIKNKMSQRLHQIFMNVSGIYVGTKRHERNPQFKSERRDYKQKLLKKKPEIRKKFKTHRLKLNLNILSQNDN